MQTRKQIMTNKIRLNIDLRISSEMGVFSLWLQDDCNTKAKLWTITSLVINRLMIWNNLSIFQIMTYWSILISELDFKSISDLICSQEQEGFSFIYSSLSPNNHYLIIFHCAFIRSQGTHFSSFIEHSQKKKSSTRT